MFHQVGKGYVSLAYTLIPSSNPSDDDYEIDHSNGNNEEIVITADDKSDIYYRKLSNIRRTKSQNLNDSRLVLHLSLPNLLKPGVK